jgi:erythromycin esterase
MKPSRSFSAAPVVAAFLLLGMAPGARAQSPAFETTRPARPPKPAGYPVLPGIWRLHGNEPRSSMEDLEPLRQVVGKATVVALGESIHTSGGFYQMKHRVFRFLVEQMGFRAFAIESPWQGAEAAAAYVQTCAGTPEDAIEGLFGVWESEELRDLVQWMCEWNRSHPKPKDRLSFFGFDIQQPEADGPALIAFLDRIGIGGDDPRVAAVQACDGVVARNPPGAIPEAPHAQCLEGLQQIDDHFRGNAKAIQKLTSKAELEMAKVRLVGLRAWENEVYYYRSDFARSYSERDHGMAYAFQTLRALRFPKAKVALWAHNSHISKAVLPDGNAPMGSHLKAALGRSYVSFGLTAYEVGIDWPGVGCGDARFRLTNSVEQALHDLGQEALFVDLRFPGAEEPYLPPGPRLFGDRLLDPRVYHDGILYLESSPKMHPLAWPSCG